MINTIFSSTNLVFKYQAYYQVYINNIFIISDSVDNYLKYLNIIFILFVLKNIILLPKKSYFGYLNIKFLSFYISKFRIFIIKERIKAFRKFAFLNTLKALK
ncbi:hypothetical protein QR685DRAFT_567708 [Neurospora intermedia]|uniref:Ribosomal protein L5 n=1 Tax=Neurospora intermedia TaxID=5142 RepID=A0ABR3DQ60_NEUIN